MPPRPPRRRTRRVPFGVRREKPWPEREDINPRPIRLDDEDGGADGPPRDRGPRRSGDDDGGAGVREPRRPKPTMPGEAAMAEPEPDRFLDLGDGGHEVATGAP